MSDVAIRIENLGKRFQLRHASAPGAYRTLREDLLHLPQRTWRAIRGARNASEEFWALRDISLEIQRGEILGLIGRNGAGKSTLLKILSRIISPTTGSADLFGRVGSLLEVGTGFHPELTGRENIFLSGAILGMRRDEVRACFDKIVAFAGVERFIDTPCKYYSSGMYTRLGFAVAAHLQTEILLVDEVLAVGDAEFQRRCLGKIGDVARSGRTVVIVSHNLGSLQSICGRGILVENGQLILAGTIEEVAEDYVRRGSLKTPAPTASVRGNHVTIEGTTVRDADGVERAIFSPQEPVQIAIDHVLESAERGIRLVVQLSRGFGEIAFASTDQKSREEVSCTTSMRSIVTIPAGLLNLGSYDVHVWCGIPGRETLVAAFRAARFTVEGTGNQGSNYPDGVAWPGAVCPNLAWHLEPK